MTLFGVTGGGRVGDEDMAEIRVLANDKPYGSSVSMDNTHILTKENEQNSTIVAVPFSRR